jgi:hypothetical protein
MVRKGWQEEYLAKQMLIKQVGELNVLKLAIGQAADFIVFEPNQNKIKAIVEVKKRSTKIVKSGNKTYEYDKYYMSENKDQWERMIRFAREHGIPLELWKKKQGERDFEIIRVV